MKHNIDDIYIRVPADQGYETVCFTDAPEEHALDFYNELDEVAQHNTILHLHDKLLELMKLLSEEEQAIFYRSLLVGVVEQYGIETQINEEIN